MKANKEQIIELIKALFERSNFVYQYHEDTESFHAGMKLTKDIESANLVILVSDTYFCVLYYLLLDVEVASRSNMADLICRINEKVTNGFFSLDSDDNTLKYKLFENCSDRLPTERVILESILVPALMIDQYSKCLHSVACNTASPADAMALIYED